jgi:hypothetical protein
MFPSACIFIVCWFPLSFTTCLGLHGHLQACRILHMFIFIYLRIKTDKQNPGLCFRLRAALLYVGFHCLSLHVSAYMAIFKCVGFLIYLWIKTEKQNPGLCFFRLRAALMYVRFRCLSLHVSAYMAIFKCVGLFICLFSYI